MIQNRITMTYDHTDGRTFTLTYERCDDGWIVALFDPADTGVTETGEPAAAAVYFDDWRCWATLSDTDFSDVVELDPVGSFRRILGHYLECEVTGPWQTLQAGPVVVHMGGVS